MSHIESFQQSGWQPPTFFPQKPLSLATPAGAQRVVQSPTFHLVSSVACWCQQLTICFLSNWKWSSNKKIFAEKPLVNHTLVKKQQNKQLLEKENWNMNNPSVSNNAQPTDFGFTQILSAPPGRQNRTWRLEACPVGAQSSQLSARCFSSQDDNKKMQKPPTRFFLNQLSTCSSLQIGAPVLYSASTTSPKCRHTVTYNVPRPKLMYEFSAKSSFRVERIWWLRSCPWVMVEFVL